MMENSMMMNSLPDTSVYIGSTQLQEAQSRNKKLQVKLEEQEQKTKLLQTQKQQLKEQLASIIKLYDEALKNNQVLQNSLENNVHLLKLQKKETESFKQQVQASKNYKEKEHELNKQISQLKLAVQSLEKQLENKNMITQRLTNEVNQNSSFVEKIQSMSQLTAAAKRETQDVKQQLEKQRQQKAFYKNSLASNFQKTMALQQQFSRYKKMAKSMVDDLTTGFNRQKKIWKQNYSSDLTFYKEEYQLFKSFVQDILRYLKINNLYTGLAEISPHLQKILETQS